jgi:hypothetical protein
MRPAYCDPLSPRESINDLILIRRQARTLPVDAVGRERHRVAVIPGHRVLDLRTLPLKVPQFRELGQTNSV